MSIQEQIAPYLNRLVLLFNQNATAKLEIGCSKGRVSVNISQDLGALSKTPATHQAEKQKFSDVLKKSVSPSKLRRLKKRAETRAEKAKVPAQNHDDTAEKAIEEISKAVQEAEKVKKEAINAKQEAEKAKTEAEDAKADLENYKAMIREKKCTHCLYAWAKKILLENSEILIFAIFLVFCWHFFLKKGMYQPGPGF